WETPFPHLFFPDFAALRLATVVACDRPNLIGTLGRVGQPGDIASIAVFLASNDSAWLTGEQLLAGGGFR
ncbi:MAG: SDR family oxidoreductase, partial [Chthoniobacterales bacterium]